ncbi:hypothetical protein [Dactylosporangium sp. NPDC048998]
MDIPEPDCWLHPDVKVRPSSIAGDGLRQRRLRDAMPMSFGLVS